jgi:HEAT repeat protein
MSRWLFYLLPLALLLAGCGGPNLDDAVSTYEDESKPLEDRLAAMQNIIASGDDSAVDTMIAALDAEEPALRAKAAGGLGYYLADRSLDPLIERLGDENAEVREAAVRSLVLFGETAVDSLIRTLRFTDEDKETPEATEFSELRRESASKALVSIGEPAVDPMLEKLAELQRESFRSALAILTDPALNLKVSEDLGAYIDVDEIDPEEDYAANATDSAARFIKRLSGKNATSRKYLKLCLDALEIDQPHYLNVLRADDETAAALRFTDQAFANLGLKAINPLIQLRETDSDAAQLMSTHYLGYIGGPEATRVLIGILNENSDYAGLDVKETALEGLGTIGNNAAIAELFNTIRKPDLQNKAGEQIERIGLPAVEYLVDRLEDNDPKLRALAMWFFNYTDNGAYHELALEGLLANLVVPNKVIRENAALTLANMPELAFEPVSELVASEDPDIREAVATCLSAMNIPRARPLLEQLANDEVGAVKSAADEGLRTLEMAESSAG